MVGIKKKANELIICIMDNGNEIPETIRQQIFTPFFTTKPTSEGNTGLGLSISIDIKIQEYQGTITIESQVGHYTKFVITLPVEHQSNAKSNMAISQIV